MKIELIAECDKCHKVGRVDIHSNDAGYYGILENDLMKKGWYIINNDDIDESKTACILCSECYSELMLNINNLYRRFMESKI